EYSDIFHRVLGRGEEPAPQNAPGGIWLDEKTVQAISSALANIQLHIGLQSVAQQIQPIQAALESAGTCTIDEMLSDIIDSLASIAKQLEKPAPKVNIAATEIRLRESAGDLMNNIFSHILRNSV